MDDSTLDLSAPIGVSGIFLTDTAKFTELHRQFAELLSITSRFEGVDARIRNCNDPAWLISFEKRCLRLNRDPRTELPELVQDLESQKNKLQAQKDETEKTILQLEPTALDVSRTLAPRFGVFSGQREYPRLKKNPDIAARNTIIDARLDEPNEVICNALDFELGQPDRPTQGIPDSWIKKYGVKTFREAYNRCPNLVHAMIWKRRARRHSPPSRDSRDS